MDHAVEPDRRADRPHPDAHPAAEEFRFPDPPWLIALPESEEAAESDAVLPHEPGEQVPGDVRSATRAIKCGSTAGSSSNALLQGRTVGVQEVALSSVSLRPAHRRIVMDARSLEALRSSINAIELRQPLLVRPVEGGRYELVTGHRRYTVLQADGRETALVEIREMTALDAALHAYADDTYHIRRRFWERALRIEEIRALLAVERGVPASDVTNRIILARLGIRKGDRSQDSLVSECLGALAVLTPEVLALAGVERDDPRVALAVSRPIYREIRDAPGDRARAAILYHAVHGHAPAWAPEAESTIAFDAASVISTRTTAVSVVVEIMWPRVPPEHSKVVRRRARAELDRLLREPPVRLSLPALTTRAVESHPQSDAERIH